MSPRGLDERVGGLAGRNCSIMRVKGPKICVLCGKAAGRVNRWSSCLFSISRMVVFFLSFSGCLGGCQTLNPRVQERYRIHVVFSFSSLFKFYIPTFRHFSASSETFHMEGALVEYKLGHPMEKKKKGQMAKLAHAHSYDYNCYKYSAGD